jgi:hypothetical protein
MPTSEATLFRVYALDELGPDGYPRAWHRVAVDDLGIGVLTERRFGIKDLVREQAGHRCVRCHHPYRNGEHGSGEWSACDERCRFDHVPFRLVYENDPGPDPPLGSGLCRPVAERSTFQRIEARWRILTVHHLNGDKSDCRWWNLCPLCQRCHLTIQGRVVMERAFILEHSSWFKPYAAGWYAWKYLGEDIGRDEAVARQDELLALERIF